MGFTDRPRNIRNATAAGKFKKNLVTGPNLIRIVQNLSVARILSIPTGCPMGSIVLREQHSDGTSCTKSSDANAAALVALSSRHRAAAVEQKIRRKCYRHGSRGNKPRPSPGAVFVARACCCGGTVIGVPLSLSPLPRTAWGTSGRPAVAIIRCPHLSPVSHRRCQ